MHPVLFTLPNGFSIHTYGMATVLSILLIVPIVQWWARQENLPKDLGYDLAFLAILGGVCGSRLEFVRVNWHLFRNDLGRVLAIRDGGLVFYGGLIGVLLLYMLYIRYHKLSVLQVGDMLAPVIPLGHAVGRLGCLAAGCCYGLPSHHDWAITFTDALSVAPTGISLHPTQLYAVGYNLLLALGLMLLRSRRRFRGQIMLAYLTIYPLLRSVNELFRGDSERGFVLEKWLGQTLTNAQFISIAIASAAAVGWVFLLRRHRAKAG